MKNILLVFAIVSNVLVACSQKHDHHEDKDAAADEWTEMDEFHMIMAETYHPYKDAGDLKPIKERAEELKAEAIKWVDSNVPSRVDNDTVKQDLRALQSKSIALAELVRSGSDKEIGDALNELHDLFHKIQEAWYGKGAAGGHDHDEQGHEHP